jgi:stachyose synthetase
MADLAVVKIVEGGIGLVHPDQAGDFYDSMHSYLADAGITGVKVDVIHVRLLFIDIIYFVLF